MHRQRPPQRPRSSYNCTCFDNELDKDVTRANRLLLPHVPHFKQGNEPFKAINQIISAQRAKLDFFRFNLYLSK